MELKRILARDARTANEKAMAQYGPDVLIISSSQVNDLTELIVAVDIPPLSLEEAEPYLKKEFVEEPAQQPKGKFDVLLGQTIEQNKRMALERTATKAAKPIVEVAPVAEPIKIKAAGKTTANKKVIPKEELQAAEEHDTLRGREIVALVREELASLRREFKLSQQMSAWQGNMPLPPAVVPLRDALNEAPIPVTLRALLVDSIKDHDNMADAMGALSRQLSHAVEQEQVAAPLSGVHVLAGPSGAGKSMMVARLAQAAAIAHGCEKVMVISFQDQRAGAWNQTQLLSAQSGVDCYRATNAQTVKLLLEEHEGRQLILIDTPGVQMDERLMDIRQMNVNAHCHAVIPVDASAATIRRVFENTDNVWHSLMLSKLDESTQPWALLQFLTDKTVSVSVASKGDRASDLVQEVSLSDLVQTALDHLPLPTPETKPDIPTLTERASSLNELAAAKLAQIAAVHKTSTTGATHE
ncbi:MAG: Signal recognition particle 54 kDa protein [Pseudomonadota bacterium]|jgi:flagellar biosynthesis GTPase FlhF